MPMSSSCPPRLRAAIYADAVSEDEAVCHQNIADELGDFVLTAAGRWRASPAGFMAQAPDMTEIFAGIADVLSDTLEGLSSGHLQALHAARKAAQ